MFSELSQFVLDSLSVQIASCGDNFRRHFLQVSETAKGFWSLMTHDSLSSFGHGTDDSQIVEKLIGKFVRVKLTVLMKDESYDASAALTTLMKEAPHFDHAAINKEVGLVLRVVDPQPYDEAELAGALAAATSKTDNDYFASTLQEWPQGKLLIKACRTVRETKV